MQFSDSEQLSIILLRVTVYKVQFLRRIWLDNCVWLVGNYCFKGPVTISRSILPRTFLREFDTVSTPSAKYYRTVVNNLLLFCKYLNDPSLLSLSLNIGHWHIYWLIIIFMIENEKHNDTTLRKRNLEVMVFNYIVNLDIMNPFL